MQMNDVQNIEPKRKNIKRKSNISIELEEEEKKVGKKITMSTRGK